MYFIYYKNNNKTHCKACHDGEAKMLQEVLKLQSQGNEVTLVYTSLGQRVY